MSPKGLGDICVQVGRLLDELGIPYLIGGSMATLVHGIPRLTRDVDIVALIDLDDVQPLVAALGTEFYIDEQMIRDAIHHHTSFNIIHFETVDKIDFFVPARGQRIAIELTRSRRLALHPELPENDAVFASPEDNVLRKLEWYRAGGGQSEQQWRDVLGVLKTQGSALEFDYMREWADTLGIRDLLERALDESGSPDRG